MAKPVLTKEDQEGIAIIVIFATFLCATATGLILTGFLPFGVALGLGILSLLPWFAVLIIGAAFLYSGFHWQ